MKQHITPTQALEITEEQFYSLFDEIVKRSDWANYHHKKVTIGKCIEILESHDKCINITNATFNFVDEFTWEIRLRHLDALYYSDELINALWKAVKEIL